MHGQAPCQGVTLPNPALLCLCNRKEHAVSRNNPESSLIMTTTRKAELSLPAPQGAGCYTAFPSPQEILEIRPNCSTSFGQRLQGTSSSMRHWVVLIFCVSPYQEQCHSSRHVPQLAESNKPQHLTWQDFAAKQSS